MTRFHDFRLHDEDPEDRRCNRRLLCSDLITLHWKTDRGMPRQEIAVLEDYSVNGAGLHISMQIEPGVEILIRTAWESFGARVRRCIWRDDGYLLGVEFNEPRPEDSPFEPDHLVDPQEIGI
jgi:hypothetical protein